MPFSYEAPVVVITISKHVRTNHPDSSTYSELYQLSTEFPRPLHENNCEDGPYVYRRPSGIRLYPGTLLPAVC